MKLAPKGNVFGLLTVISELPMSDGLHTLWKCECKCGVIKYVRASKLRYALKKVGIISCGCARKQQTRKATFKDITGQKFNNLTAICEDGHNKHGMIVWKWQCDCGNIYRSVAYPIIKKLVKSCGCYYRRTMNNIIGKTINNLTVVRVLGRNDSNNLIMECKCICGDLIKVQLGNLLTGNTKGCKSCGSKIGGEKNTIDLTGKRYTMLVARKMYIDEDGNKLRTYDGSTTFWECDCDCGNKVIVSTNNLNNKNTHSCGCYKISMASMCAKENKFKMMMSRQMNEEERKREKDGLMSSDFH